MPDNALLAGVELGGTKTIVVLARGQEILRSEAIPTASPGETLPRAASVLRQWHKDAEFAALGVASFGPIGLDPASESYGIMLPTPKPGWSGADILGTLTSGLDCPAAIDTDVNGAALAELCWGAGRHGSDPCDSLCYITIGTGVGGGFAINGQPLHGAMHPELGHIRVRRAPHDDFAGTCPFHGDCIEGLISGPALAARFGMPGARIPQDDPRWALVTDELAQLVVTVLLMTSARLVLIGGGVGMARPALLADLRQRVLALSAAYLPYVCAGTIDRIVRHPELGTLAGPLGAIAVAGNAMNLNRVIVRPSFGADL